MSMYVTLLLTMERLSILFFFFNDTATTEIYTLSLHDALPIFHDGTVALAGPFGDLAGFCADLDLPRSEEHTSELQSHSDLVCRLLLEKKNAVFFLQTAGPALGIVPSHLAVGVVEIVVDLLALQ